MDATLNDLGETSLKALPGAVSGYTVAHDELTLTAEAGRIVEVLTHLRDNTALRFVNFVDLCGVDYPGREKRFDVVWHLLSPKYNRRVRIKVQADETTPVPSTADVFPAANWFEREAFDLFGIVFDGHDDLRRILTDYGFIGHPFRKDFPTTGHVEMRFDAEQARVVYQPVTIEAREITPRIIREDKYGGLQ